MKRVPYYLRMDEHGGSWQPISAVECLACLAHREAGHAVVARVLGWALEEVYLKDANGACSGAPPAWEKIRYRRGPARRREWQRDEASILVAGIVAEFIFYGGAVENGLPELDAARERSGSAQEYERAKRRATRILLKNWPAVRALAGHLLDHEAIGGADAEKIIDAARLSSALPFGKQPRHGNTR